MAGMRNWSTLQSVVFATAHLKGQPLYYNMSCGYISIHTRTHARTYARTHAHTNCIGYNSKLVIITGKVRKKGGGAKWFDCS